jgi:hypothetical protein
MAACQKIGGGRHEKGGIPEESDGGKGQDFVDKLRPAPYDKGQVQGRTQG